MTHAGISRQGGREVNEDAFLCVERGANACFAVADGLGAHGKGDVAARLLTEAFAREFGATAEPNGAFLAKAFDAAQKEILAARQTAREMKTTGVALAVAGGKLAWGHIGDSRLYFFRGGKLRLRTLDHSVPQMLALSKQIRNEEIARHPDRGKLLRVLGEPWDSPRYELSKARKISSKDAFLLCSDGFWELIDDGCMASCLKKSGNAEDWLFAMLSSADWTGAGQDNYTAVAVMM